MTVRKPTVASTQFQKRRGLAFFLGMLVAIVAFAALNIAISTAIVAFALNVVAGFGFSFAQCVGFGLLLATVSPTATYTLS